MLDILRNFPTQCIEATKLGHGIKINCGTSEADSINEVVIAGVGGSAFAGDVVECLAGKEVRVRVSKGYSLPFGVGKNSLVFAVSYSGNTEETISAFEEAVKKNIGRVIGVGSGGKLEALCKKQNFAFIKVPGGLPPRGSTGYLALSILNVLIDNHIISSKWIEKIGVELKDSDAEQTGKAIGERVFKKIPLVYSSDDLECISYGWKMKFNENSKIHAFANKFPELDHNELVGYTKKNGDFHTILVRDSGDNLRIKKRFDITQKLIERLGGECTVVNTKGSNLASRVFYALYVGDWASFYLALKNKVEARPVEIIEELKKEMEKNKL